MKLSSISLIILMLSSFSLASANSRGIIDQSKINCGLAKGCTVSCGYWDVELKHINNIKEIYLTIYENGITKMDLIKKNLRGTETMLIGPKSYYCDIENP